MNVTQVLEGTLSPDATTRQSAEQQLLHAAEVDFPAYLITLSEGLANEESPSHIRIAAGLALKNSLTFRDIARLREVQVRWAQQVPQPTKTQVKTLSLQTLNAKDVRAGHSAAQVITAIASIELPRNEWPELMQTLVQNVGSGTDALKQSSLATLGFICEEKDADMRTALSLHSNAILTAVVQGARRDEANPDVRNAALQALADATDFIGSNMGNEGERNYIMQVVCEATQAEDTRIQAGAFGCLNRIMATYYDKMRFYMEKALFGLTIMGMKHDEEDVAKLAIEFWCTVCEEEITIEDDNAGTHDSSMLRPFFNFARIACREVVPVLLQLMTKQDEDATDDEYNVSRAAYQALQLYAQCVQGDIIQPVLTFVEENIKNEDWHRRDAAVASFGAIMDGPEIDVLEPLVKQALPVLLGMMEDQSVVVRDSTAFALGKICEACPTGVDTDVHLQPLISALFNGLASTPKIAGSCCWALISIAENFSLQGDSQTNPLSKYFQESVKNLLALTERHDTENQLRTAAYEVLNAWVINSANDSLQMVASLSDVILQRLEQTVPLQQQVVSVEDRIALEEMQSSLTVVLLAIVQRLEGEIKPQADRIMHVLLQVLSTLPPKSSVPDIVFAAVGAVASALEDDFLKYMESFTPFLYKALQNHEEPGLCAIGVGLIGDITRALNDKVQPFCDTFMNQMLSILTNSGLRDTLKPSVLVTFGDIAQAIGTSFETYLSVVAQVLQQASSVTLANDVDTDTVQYVISLREGIMDAWGGILLAYKAAPQIASLQPYVESIFQLLHIISQEAHRSEGLMRSSMGVLGDLADSFPNGEFAAFFRNDWVTSFVREVRTSPHYGSRTLDTARWAREQVKRQISLATAAAMS
ncbi:importin beta-1 subunit [Talaromyces proteolyticus]|uniref:Importin-95 n=1 Tax=Talaromyces proteolyticus TaxID=1131652 RepID=A0AAD4KTN7_9EURO|nr:importin beta-1 subunit [Talaromyces proteolyticus]KAH8699047.1 importin beta-1 subunit [Talaromyces proteolyticus]